MFWKNKKNLLAKKKVWHQGPSPYLPERFSSCRNWHLVTNCVTVAGLHRASPSTSLDKENYEFLFFARCQFSLVFEIGQMFASFPLFHTSKNLLR
jgi:hypothetical protein